MGSQEFLNSELQHPLGFPHSSFPGKWSTFFSVSFSHGVLVMRVFIAQNANASEVFISEWTTNRSVNIMLCGTLDAVLRRGFYDSNLWWLSAFLWRYSTSVSVWALNCWQTIAGMMFNHSSWPVGPANGWCFFVANCEKTSCGIDFFSGYIGHVAPNVKRLHLCFRFPHI